jgi:uncharacterized coiled-coil protein SlyX
MTSSQPVEARVISLELLVTHFERDLAALNSAVLDQQKEIEMLKRIISQLEERIGRMGEGDEPRSADDERPPHY